MSSLERLQAYLRQDPNNLGLLASAAEAAFEARELEAARSLLDRHACLADLPPYLVNLAGLVDLAGQQYVSAASRFETLLHERPGDLGLRFNLAVANAMLGNHQAASEVLDDAAAGATEAAAVLKVRSLHHLGQLEEALETGRRLAARHPGSSALNGALATVAVDLGDLDAARAFADRSLDTDTGLAAAGALQLADHKPRAGLRLFDDAIGLNPDNSRALLGKGLALAALGDARAAVGFVDQAATRFNDHVGSWIASGWLHFANDDLAASRAAFEKALALDDTFAESHGALAVLDLVEGHAESGRRRSQVSQRLDRRSLGAILAASFVKADDGDLDAAERMRRMALNMPVGPKGETVADALVALGLERRP